MIPAHFGESEHVLIFDRTHRHTDLKSELLVKNLLNNMNYFNTSINLELDSLKVPSLTIPEANFSILSNIRSPKNE